MAKKKKAKNIKSKQNKNNVSKLAKNKGINKSTNKASQLTRKEREKQRKKRIQAIQDNKRRNKNNQSNESKTLAFQRLNNIDYLTRFNIEYNPNEKLEDYSKRLEDLFYLANTRWERIEALGLSSNAIERALSENNNQPYFNIEQDNVKSLLKEAIRASVFLSDDTSTTVGANLYTVQLNAAQYKGKFGNQYKNWKHNYKTFNTDVIDENVAKRAFAAYRRIEEVKAALIMEYGSENLITAIYDAEIRGMDGLLYGMDLLDAYYKKKSETWNKIFTSENSVKKVLKDILEEEENNGILDWL